MGLILAPDNKMAILHQIVGDPDTPSGVIRAPASNVLSGYPDFLDK